jgi:hypothetical protein
MIMMPMIRPILRNAGSVRPVVEEPSTKPPKKKMKWGEPTWIFLHTIAQKIKDDRFLGMREQLLQKINMICRNLPCPDCSAHASKYLDAINFNMIVTKQDLITFLWTFHNEVNKRKGIPIADRSVLDKYCTANTNNVINYFIVMYSDKSPSIKMIANDFHRKRLIKELQTWLIEHLSNFDA